MTEDMLDVWRESAKYWTKHSDTIHQMFVPLTRALIERAGIHQGRRCSTLLVGQANRRSRLPR